MSTRTRTARRALLCLALVTAAMGCDTDAGESIRTTPLETQDRVRVNVSGTAALRTQDAWQEFRVAYVAQYPESPVRAAPETAPDVDFTRQVVIGVFYGGDVHAGCTHDVDVIRRAALDGRTLRVALAPLPDLGPCRMVADPLDIAVVDVAPKAFVGVRFTGPLP